ncbi:MAG: gliding motility-associated protein GldE [Bacteroidales bacterium]|nr:gliding motility-associated protein GldE [Bacteroidales bacterium]
MLVNLILFLCSAMISGAEVAFFSLNPAQKQLLKDGYGRNSRLIIELLETPKKLLATILIVNNFVNVTIVILSAFLIGRLFDFSPYPFWGYVIQVFAITFLILLLGEILPKIYATQRALSFAHVMARPMFVLIAVFRPLSILLERSTRIIDRKVARKTASISMSELSDAIDITSSEETPEEERQILRGIVKFGDTEVREIMKSRMDVTTVESSVPFPELIRIVIQSGYSRIPVFEENFDKVLGILYIKDLLPHLDETGEFNWLHLVRPVVFVPENKRISDLMQEFQEKKMHMAVVVDEYGGTSGIVTLEDIIEEIIGEISDEFDVPGDEVDYTRLDERNFLFEGRTSLNDFCKITGVDDKLFDRVKGDSDTLAGLILELEGEIPHRGTQVEFDRFLFRIETADSRRIKKIRVTMRDVDPDA